MKWLLLLLVPTALVSGDWFEVGTGGALTTNRPFCGS